MTCSDSLAAVYLSLLHDTQSPESPTVGNYYYFCHILLIRPGLNCHCQLTWLCSSECLTLNSKCSLIWCFSYFVHRLEQHFSAHFTSWPFPIWADRKEAIQFQWDKRGVRIHLGHRQGWKGQLVCSLLDTAERMSRAEAAACKQRSTHGKLWFCYCYYNLSTKNHGQ